MEPSLVYALETVGDLSVSLRPEQKPCRECVFDGKDAFVWLPTGSGKSICLLVHVWQEAWQRQQPCCHRSPLSSAALSNVCSSRLHFGQMCWGRPSSNRTWMLRQSLILEDHRYFPAVGLRIATAYLARTGARHKRPAIVNAVTFRHSPLLFHTSSTIHPH